MQEILERLDAMQSSLQRLDAMDERLQRLEQKVDTGLQGLEHKMDAGLQGLEHKMDAGLQRLEQKMDAGFEQVDRRFEQVDRRFEGLEAQVHRQGVMLESVQTEVKMALEGIIGNRQVMDEKFAELNRKMDERVQPIEMASREFGSRLAARPKRRPRD